MSKCHIYRHARPTTELDVWQSTKYQDTNGGIRVEHNPANTNYLRRPGGKRSERLHGGFLLVLLFAGSSRWPCLAVTASAATNGGEKNALNPAAQCVSDGPEPACGPRGHTLHSRCEAL